MNPPQSRRLQAFTLIEVLVATGVLVMIILAIYSTWSMILRASAVGQKVAIDVQRSRIAIAAVEDALLTAQMFSENAQYYAFVTDTADQDYHYLSLVSRLPPTFPGSGLFGDQTLRRVTFEVVDGEDGNKQLLMTQIPVLLMTNETVQPYPIVLVRDLTWFVIEFWDKQRGEWMADFKATNQIPVMMRVTIGWGHVPGRPSEPSDVVTRTVAIPGSIIAGDVQRPQVGAAPGNNPGGGNRPGGNRPGGNNPGGNNPGGNYPGGNYPGGNRPGGMNTRPGG